MENKIINIAIIEPSALIYEGLASLIIKNSRNCRIYKIEDLDEINHTIKSKCYKLILINPNQVQNRLNSFRSLKLENPHTKWIGIISSLFESNILDLFEALIGINDSAEIILKTINELSSATNTKSESSQESLTDRELDVLVLLVNGKSNKEIAEILSISIHTVNSHRKNITSKTGIKSQSGLTIYAISRKLISIDNIK